MGKRAICGTCGRTLGQLGAVGPRTLFGGVVCAACGKVECSACKGRDNQAPCRWCGGQAKPAYDTYLQASPAAAAALPPAKPSAAAPPAEKRLAASRPAPRRPWHFYAVLVAFGSFSYLLGIGGLFGAGRRMPGVGAALAGIAALAVLVSTTMALRPFWRMDQEAKEHLGVHLLLFMVMMLLLPLVVVGRHGSAYREAGYWISVVVFLVLGGALISYVEARFPLYLVVQTPAPPDERAIRKSIARHDRKAGQSTPETRQTRPAPAARLDPEPKLELAAAPERIDLGPVEGGVSALAATADRLVVARNGTAAVELWDLQGRILATFRGHEKPAKALAISDDGTLLASAEEGGKAIALWDGEGRELRVIERPAPVKSLALGPAMLAIGHADGSIAVLSLPDAARVHDLRFPLPPLANEAIDAVALTRDGTRLAAFQKGGALATWKLGDGNAAVLVVRHRLLHMEYSSDGRYLAVVGARFEVSADARGESMTFTGIESILVLLDAAEGREGRVESGERIFEKVGFLRDDVLAIVGHEAERGGMRTVLSFHGREALREGRGAPIASVAAGKSLFRSKVLVPGQGLLVCEEEERLVLWKLLHAAASRRPVTPAASPGGQPMDVVPGDLRAVAFGVTNVGSLTISAEEGVKLAFDLLERWNPELFRALAEQPPSAQTRVLGAASTEELVGMFKRMEEKDYRDCLAILQHGEFEVGRASTGASARVEVILGTYWKTASGGGVVVVVPGQQVAIRPKSPVRLAVAPATVAARPVPEDDDHGSGRPDRAGTDAGGAPSVSERDLDAIAALWRDQGRTWWEDHPSRDHASCDRCNARLDRAQGSLSGSYLLCSKCADKSLSGALERLRADPSWFGAGVLEKARAARTAPPAGRAPERATGRLFDRTWGLTILKFPRGSERSYENHVRLVRHLREEKAYPRLDIVAYVAKSDAARLARMIALTGPSSEIAKLDRVFYDPRAEAFVTRELGNDWNAINPSSSLSNVAVKGCAIDMEGLERELEIVEEEIAAQRYERVALD